jgi:ATP-dependent DNA helicase RecG
MLFKNNLTREQLIKLGLNDRQVKAVLYMLENGSITNSQYQKLNDTSKPTATRDLQELEAKGIFANKGTKGSSSKYELEY